MATSPSYISLTSLFLSLNLFSQKRFTEFYQIYFKNYLKFHRELNKASSELNKASSELLSLDAELNEFYKNINLKMKTREELIELERLISRINEILPADYDFEGKKYYRTGNVFLVPLTDSVIFNFISLNFSGSLGALGAGADLTVRGNNKIFFLLSLKAFTYYYKGFNLNNRGPYFILENNDLKIRKDSINVEIFTELIAITNEYGLDEANRWLASGYEYLNMDGQVFRMDLIAPYLDAMYKYLLFEINPLMEDSRRHYNNEIEISRLKIEVETSGKTCKNCGSQNSVSVLVQTRSRDEGYTLIVKCLDCKRKI